MTTDLPKLTGYTFRLFVHDDDYAKTLKVFKAANLADEVEEQPTLDEHRHWLAHAPNFDLAQDLLLIEAQGDVVGYAFVWWRALDTGDQTYFVNSYYAPNHRTAELQHATLTWSEARARAKSVTAPAAPRFFQSWVPDTASYRAKFLESRGYQVVRNFFLMQYAPLVEPLAVSLPAHLEFRPVAEEQVRAIWEARNEAFRDHWGHSPQMETEQAFESFTNDPSRNLSIWRAVWDKTQNQIAGVSINSIFEEDNTLYGFKRGWVGSLGVRRAWRKSGVGRALLLESLNALRAAGMTEGMLGVDAENPTGALKLYKSAGFKVYKRTDVYRKAF